MDLYAQFGIIQKGVDGFANFQSKSVPKTGKDGFLNFDNLNDYIEHHSRVDSLTLFQLDYFFKIYFSVLALLLGLSILHYAHVRLAKRRLRFFK